MISVPPLYLALSELALRQGRRIAARDLFQHAADLDAEEARVQAAAVALQGHGFRVRISRAPLAAWSPAALPAVLTLKSGGACVLLAIDGAEAEVAMAGVDAPGQSQRMALSAIDERFAGAAIIARPDALLDGVDPAQAPRPAHGQGHWFWRAFATLRGYYGDCVVGAVMINLLALATSMFAMNVYDRVIPNAALHSLWVLAIGVTLAGVLEFALRTMRGYLVDVAGKKADLLLSARIFRHALNLRAEDRPQSSGQFAGNLREFETVRDFVSSSTLVALTDLPFVILFLAVVAFLGGPLVWVPVAGATLILVAGALSQLPVRRAIERYQYENAHKLGFMVEALERLELIRALGAERAVQGRWERVSAMTARSAMSSRLASAIATNFTLFVQQFCNTALIIGGVYLILEGRLTTGALIGCTILAGRALGPLGQVAGLLTRYQHASSAYRTLDRVMSQPGHYLPERNYVGIDRARGELRVQGLRFAYPRSERTVLDIGTLTLQPGQVVGLSGPVGSGKSTLLKVLAGLHSPTEGQILLDGLDARQIGPADFRAQVAWAGQDAVLFRGSLRENLLLAAPLVSDTRLQKVLALTGLLNVIAAHPQGLDMQLGENGNALSGGQRQMIALARALLADTPVLLLDEPTSAFDAAGEGALLQRLAPELQGRTVVISTHRPGPLALVGRLIVLDHGQVVADGPRDAVLEAVQAGQVGRAQVARRPA